MIQRHPGRAHRPFAALLLASLAACGDGPTAPGTPEPITELPRALAPAEAALLDAGNRFGFDLLETLAPAHASENLFFSPLSASMALGMTLNGAAGQTFEEMRTVLGYGGLSQEEINAAYATLLELLQNLDPAVTVEIANSVWYRAGLQVNATFLDRVRAAFAAEVADVVFTDPATVSRINGWVADRTRGTIEKLVDSLPGNLVMLLMNAVYFKGDWTDAFDPAETKAGSFRTGPERAVTADFMTQRMEVRYHRTESWELVEMPYGGQAYAMTVVLPAEGVDPVDLTASLDAGTWAAWVGAAQEVEAVVELPKFELEWERTLNDDLAALGMEQAFIPGGADFTRMIPGGGVWVDKVLQKSFVRVDEEGTEASAVTSVFVAESAVPVVRADRPFVFAIRERLSGTVLFLGVVRDPS